MTGAAASDPTPLADTARRGRGSVRRTLASVVGLPTLALILLAAASAFPAVAEVRHIGDYRDSVDTLAEITRALDAIDAEADDPATGPGNPEAAAARTDEALRAVAAAARERPGLVRTDAAESIADLPAELAIGRERTRLTPFARNGLLAALHGASTRLAAAVSDGVDDLTGTEARAAGRSIAVALQAGVALRQERRWVAIALEGDRGGATTDATEIAEVVAASTSARRVLRDRLSAAEGLALDRTAGAAVDEVRTAFGMPGAAVPTISTTTWRGAVARQIDAVDATTRVFAEQLRNQLDQEIERSTRRLAMLATAVVLVILLATGLAVHRARRMARRIAKLDEAATALSEGRLTSAVDVGGDDEIAAVGTTMRRLHEILLEVESDVRHVNEAVAEADQPEPLDVRRYPGDWAELARAVNGAVDRYRELNRRITVEMQRQSALRSFGDVALSGVSRGQLFDDVVRLLAANLPCRRAEVWERIGDGDQAVRRAAEGDTPETGQRVAPWPPPTVGAGTALVEHPGGPSSPVAVIVRFDPTVTVEDTDRRFAETAIGLLGTALSRLTAEDRALHAALTDPITGLPNSRHLEELLRRLLLTAAGRSDVTVIEIRLEHVERLLSRFGRRAVDAVLAELGQRLMATTAPPDVLGHHGSGRFVIATPQLGETFDATLERHLGAFTLPVTVEDAEVRPQCAVGITEVPRGARRDPAAALHETEVACQWAAEHGDGRPVRFDLSIGSVVDRRARIVDDLRDLLTDPGHAGLSVVFHPVLDLATGLPTGVESLARWRHPVFGMVPPPEFIGAAERHGLIGDLGLVITRTALRRIPRLDTGAGPLLVGINASVVELAVAGYADRLLEVAEAEGVDPARIVIEVTETSVTDENETLLAELHRLRGHGVRIAVDDFGTGYASLGYLTRFPIDSVKIDREFVTDIDQDARHRSVVAAVVTLGHELGFRVVAEGVERPEELSVLMDLGCDAVQGFLFGRPSAPEELEADHALLGRPFVDLRRLDSPPETVIPLTGSRRPPKADHTRTGV